MTQKHQDLGFVKGRIKGGFIALKGAYLFITTEHSGMVQFTLLILLTAMGFYFRISTTEWMLHVIVVFLVLAAEALNTAIEKLCDFIHDEHHEKIGFIKDISAGGVWFAAIAALTVELLIYIPKLKGIF